ncbi:MAG: MgtC/SapB family protein, partial [Planctomycetota bacterium]|nr:MgtC/SapB family protein [Planctomycetota bacterium]
MDATSMFMALGISLALGLLVGLQREKAASQVAGIRTFALVALFGTVCGLVVEPMGGWIAGAGLLAVAAASAMANFAKVRRGDVEPGITTEIALVLMFGVGVLLAVEEARAVAVAVGVATAALLHAKGALHRFVERLGDKDVRAIMQFAVITFVILPVLPDKTFTALEVLNPRHIWLMVVLVVGISLGGYVAYKLVG